MAVRRRNPDYVDIPPDATPSDDPKIAELENLLLERSEELRESEKRCAALGEQLATAVENARRVADEYEAITDGNGVPKKPKPGYYILMIAGVNFFMAWLYIWLKSNRDAEPLFPGTVAALIVFLFVWEWTEVQWKSSDRWLLLMRVPLLLFGAFIPIASIAIVSYAHKEIADRYVWSMTIFFSLILLLVQSPLCRWMADSFKRFMRNPLQIMKAFLGD